MGLKDSKGADLKGPIKISPIGTVWAGEVRRFFPFLSFIIASDRETHQVCVGTGLTLMAGKSSKRGLCLANKKDDISESSRVGY